MDMSWYTDLLLNALVVTSTLGGLVAAGVAVVLYRDERARQQTRRS